MPTHGTCKLCEKHKELQKSHAIGNAVFKKLFKTLSGKAITFHAGEGPISYSSNSWAELQLCKSCEHILNTEYERYSVNVLRDYKNCTKTDNCLILSHVDQYKLLLYFLSIYYRSALSSQKPYDNVKIIKRHWNLLKRVLLNDEKIGFHEIPVKISRLIDSSEGGFSYEGIKEIIISPYCVMTEGKKLSMTVCFIFEGFLIEIFITGTKFKNRNDHGVLNGGRANLYIPYVEILSIPKVLDIFVDALEKYEDGNHNIKE